MQKCQVNVKEQTYVKFNPNEMIFYQENAFEMSPILYWPQKSVHFKPDKL